MTNKVCKCGQPAVTVVTPHGEEPWDSCGECAQKAWDAGGDVRIERFREGGYE